MLVPSTMSRRLLASATAIVAWAMGSCVAPAQGLLPDLPVCERASVPSVPIGEQLARAEELRKAAKKLEAFDYDRCYGLGRSCFGQVESPIGVEDESYRTCGQFSVRERSTFDVWLPLKRREIACIIENLSQRADALQQAALGPQAAAETSPVAAVIAQLAGQERTLDGATLGRLASGATWCSLPIFRVRALCADGTGAVVDGRGQQALTWQVVGDRICLATFGDAQSCFSLRIAGGRLALMTEKSEQADLIAVTPGVVETWARSCPPK